MWSPAHRYVFCPLHSLDERRCSRRQQELIVCYGDKAKVRVETSILLYLQQKLATGPHKRTVVGQGIGRAVSVTESIYDRAQFR